MVLDPERLREDEIETGNGGLGGPSPEPAAEPSAQPLELVCPECLAQGQTRTFDKPQGLSRHRQAMHGIESEYRKKLNQRKSRKKTVAAKPARKPRMVKPTLNERALLKMVFPMGMPLDPDVMEQTTEWISTARELYSAK